MPVLLRLRAWIVDVPAFLFGHANHRAMLLRACEKNTDILAFVLWNANDANSHVLAPFLQGTCNANALARARLGC